VWYNYVYMTYLGYGNRPGLHNAIGSLELIRPPDVT
jgi:hypothetical protein